MEKTLPYFLVAALCGAIAEKNMDYGFDLA